MARKRKLSQSSDDFIASDSGEEAYEPKTAAGSSRRTSTKVTSRKKRAPPKQGGSKKARKTKGEVEDVRIKKLILPFANEKGEGVVVIYALGRWIVHVLDRKVSIYYFYSGTSTDRRCN